MVADTLRIAKATLSRGSDADSKRRVRYTQVRRGFEAVSFDELYPGASVRWFTWQQVRPALAYGRQGGIALHYFRYDLRHFGLGARAPACHVLSANRPMLVAFMARFGLREAAIQAPRPHRPDVWHFDAFGPVLERLEAVYPLPAHIDALSAEASA